MKKIVLISAIAMSGLIYNTASAQIRLRFGLNFGVRPVYVPARIVVEQQPVEYAQPANYDGDEDYYYLPEVDAYYSVPEQCYYYNDGNQWVSAAYLPGAYHDFDWSTARRFEVRAPRPFIHDDYYRTRYNGVAFSGNWDRGNDRGYANNNHVQYRNDAPRVDNNRQYDPNRGQQNFDRNREQDNHSYNQDNGRTRENNMQHFAQQNYQRNDRSPRDNHRPGRS